MTKKKNENRKEIMRERNNSRMIRVANINRCKIIAFRMMRRERERENVTPRPRYPSRFEVDPRVPCIGEGPRIEFPARNPS